MKLLTGLVFLATLNTTLIAGLVLLLDLSMRPFDWLLMFWPWSLVGAMVLIRKWQLWAVMETRYYLFAGHDLDDRPIDREHYLRSFESIKDAVEFWSQ